jgi:hypothetical protein
MFHLEIQSLIKCLHKKDINTRPVYVCSVKVLQNSGKRNYLKLI